MLIYYKKEQLVELIKTEIKAWEKVGGGPNLSAFAFDPKTTDPKQLEELGYFQNRDSWVAGVRIKELTELLSEVEQIPEIAKR